MTTPSFQADYPCFSRRRERIGLRGRRSASTVSFLLPRVLKFLFEGANYLQGTSKRWKHTRRKLRAETCSSSNGSVRSCRKEGIRGSSRARHGTEVYVCRDVLQRRSPHSCNQKPEILVLSRHRRQMFLYASECKLLCRNEVDRLISCHGLLYQSTLKDVD